MGNKTWALETEHQTNKQRKPSNAGIKFLSAMQPAEIFYWGF